MSMRAAGEASSIGTATEWIQVGYKQHNAGLTQQYTRCYNMIIEYAAVEIMVRLMPRAYTTNRLMDDGYAFE